MDANSHACVYDCVTHTLCSTVSTEFLVVCLLGMSSLSCNNSSVLKRLEREELKRKAEEERLRLEINDSLHHATTPKPQKWELLLSGNARN